MEMLSFSWLPIVICNLGFCDPKFVLALQFSLNSGVCEGKLVGMCDRIWWGNPGVTNDSSVPF